MRRVDIPAELKLENYEKQTHTASFDRIDLVISFRPGRDNIGATVKGFLEAIPAHDDIVKRIEEKMEEISILKRNYYRKNRLFRNLDSAWNLALDNPVDFYEYMELLPKIPKIERRLAQVDDVVIKTQLQELYDRFQLLKPKCEKQAVIYQTFSEARTVKDDAMKALLEAETDLNRLKQKEKEVALLISDDHIVADEMGKTLSALFPNVHGKLSVCLQDTELVYGPTANTLVLPVRICSPDTQFCSQLYLIIHVVCCLLVPSRLHAASNQRRADRASSLR